MSDSDVRGPFGAPVPEREELSQLRADELSLFDATAVAVSSVAPAYSLASTITAVFVIAGIGVASPAVLIVSFVPVLFVALSYFHLNRRNPNCGASYSWLADVVHPSAGWWNGWIQIWTSVLFCTTAPLLAGSYTLEFLHRAFHAVSHATVHDQRAIAVVASLWLVLVTAICIYGIRWTTNAQWVMVLVEYVAVIVFSVGGIIKVIVTHPAGSVPFSWHWLNPFAIHGWSALAQGLALGVFFFWGWDTALNLNEESRESGKVPGQAAVLSMWLLLFVFLLNIIAAQMLLGPHQIARQGEQVLFYFGNQFAGQWASYVMVFAVLTSTVATTQTTVLPAARITYAMARDGVFPRLFASIHEKYKTPALGTVVVAFLSLFGILLTTLSSSSNDVFNNLVDNIGVLVAVYYGITGLACAWAFRAVVGRHWRGTFTMVLAPLVGGAVLLFVGYEVIVSGWPGSVPDVVVLASGIPALIWARLATGRSSFWHQRAVKYSHLSD